MTGWNVTNLQRASTTALFGLFVLLLAIAPISWLTQLFFFTVAAWPLWQVWKAPTREDMIQDLAEAAHIIALARRANRRSARARMLTDDQAYLDSSSITGEIIPESHPGAHPRSDWEQSD